MKAEIVRVTPELAKEILKGNTCNRNISSHRVNLYANDMINGKWSLTGMGISINKDGRLLDGQHRLSAIIKANVAVDMLICSDIDNATEFDTGKKRSLADSYKLKLGRTDSMLTTHQGCAFIRACYVIDEAVKEERLSVTKVEYMNPSFAEIDNFVENYKDDLEAFWSEIPKGNKLVPRGLFRVIIYATLRAIVNSPKNNFTFTDYVHFVMVLKSGCIVEDFDAPIIGLRDKLILIEGGCGAINHEIRQRVAYAVKKYLDKSTNKVNRLIQSDRFSLTDLI